MLAKTLYIKETSCANLLTYALFKKIDNHVRCQKKTDNKLTDPIKEP